MDPEKAAMDHSPSGSEHNHVEHHDGINGAAGERRGSRYEHNVARKGSISASIDEAFTTSGGRRKSSVRNLDYVDHREGDDRAEEAKGRDSAAFDDKYWYSPNFIGTLLAIGFSFMAGIGGKHPAPAAFGSCNTVKQTY